MLENSETILSLNWDYSWTWVWSELLLFFCNWDLTNTGENTWKTLLILLVCTVGFGVLLGQAWSCLGQWEEVGTG